MEAQAISAKAAELAGAQDQKRTNDQIATGVAIVVFWPAAFLVGGDGQVGAQLAKLKRQWNAVEQASIQKKCGIQFRQAPASSQATWRACLDWPRINLDTASPELLVTCIKYSRPFWSR